MCQCLDVKFGSVSEVIFSQVHQLSCDKESALFHTGNMLGKLQFLKSIIKEGSHTASTDKERYGSSSYTAYAATKTDNYDIEQTAKLDYGLRHAKQS